MQTLHLFAGAGGGLLADLILGHTPIGAVELDPYCCRVLRERAADGWFPGLRVHEGDVRLFDPSEYKGRVDCLHAGFPCQPHSVAGKREGEADERNMWPDTKRIIGELRPRFVLLENVPGIFATGYVWTVLGDLAALGYDARWAIISAADAGAPHLRERWWCLAERADADEQRRGEARRLRSGQELGNGGICEVVADTESGTASKQTEWKGRENTGRGSINCGGHTDKRKKAMADTHQHARIERRPGDAAQESRGRNTDQGSERESVPDTTSAGLQNRAGEPMGRPSQITELERHDSESADTILERLEGQQQGWPATRTTDGSGDGSDTSGRKTQSDLGCMADGLAPELVNFAGWWQVEPDIGRVTNDSRNRVASLKALGNGQVPLSAALAWVLLGGPNGS